MRTLALLCFPGRTTHKTPRDVRGTCLPVAMGGGRPAPEPQIIHQSDLWNAIIFDQIKHASKLVISMSVHILERGTETQYVLRHHNIRAKAKMPRARNPSGLRQDCLRDVQLALRQGEDSPGRGAATHRLATTHSFAGAR